MFPSLQKLPQATLDVLQSSLEEFRNGSKMERRAIISKCSKETVPAGCKKSEATQYKRVSYLDLNNGRKTIEKSTRGSRNGSIITAERTEPKKIK
jgi:hypothetical protein